MNAVIALLFGLLTPLAHAAESVEWSAIERKAGCCDGDEAVLPPFRPSPGNLGPNAFYFMWHIDDARIVGDQIHVNVAYRPTRDLRGQWSHAGVVSVVIPFSEFASVEFSEMVERWKLDEPATEYYGATKATGTTLNDFVATVKFNLMKETTNRPAITLRGVIKTANGDGTDRRNSDTAGYMVSALFAKDVLHASGALRKIRVLAELGFFAWDDEIKSQNDAYRYGVATQFLFRRDFSLDVGYQGYTGWRGNGDAPRTLYVEGRKVFSPRIAAFGSVDLGMNSRANPSANPLAFSAGVRISLHRPYARKN